MENINQNNIQEEDQKIENENEEFSQTPNLGIPPSVSLELFLCNLKLYRDFFSFFKKYNVTTLEQAIDFKFYPKPINDKEEKRQKLLINNLRNIRDELPKNDLNAQIMYLLNKPSTFENAINLNDELVLKSFTNSSKLPNYCLPNKFQSQNLKPSSLYSSAIQNKKIGRILLTQHFKNLKHLFLDQNYIQKIENLNLPSLEQLNLSNNFIRKIEGLENLPNLVRVNFSYNLIQIFEGFYYNIFLEEIDLSNQYIPSFINFAIRPQSANPHNKVSSINLENNNIMQIGDIIQYPYLRNLNIEGNCVYDMMSFLSVCKMCPYLEKINVAKNPFTNDNKNTYRNFIVIACKNLNELDGKDIKQNEKIYVNNLFSRKYGNKEKKPKVKKELPLEANLQIQHVQSNSKRNSLPNPYNYYKYNNNNNYYGY